MKKWPQESIQSILRQLRMPHPRPSFPPHQLTLYIHQLQSQSKSSSAQPCHSNPSTNRIWSGHTSLKRPTLDTGRRPRIDQYQKWQQIPPVVEVDRGQITSWSSDLQNPLEHPEADVRSAWHWNTSERTWGWRRNDCGKKATAAPRCYLVSFVGVFLFLLSSVSPFFSSLFLVPLSWLDISHYGSPS